MLLTDVPLQLVHVLVEARRGTKGQISADNVELHPGLAVLLGQAGEAQAAGVVPCVSITSAPREAAIRHRILGVSWIIKFLEQAPAYIDASGPFSKQTSHQRLVMEFMCLIPSTKGKALLSTNLERLNLDSAA